MADVTAGNDENASGTHPRLEAELKVLSAPDVEAGVEAAQFQEKLARDCKETSGHRGRGNRDCGRRRPADYR